MQYTIEEATITESEEIEVIRNEETPVRAEVIDDSVLFSEFLSEQFVYQSVRPTEADAEVIDAEIVSEEQIEEIQYASAEFIDE